ncbi:uncharacterized protein LOC119691533 [Plutella xylostella]|uniref:uncharacterized protein LOC119691533 n=1 Tax=Plutella xylostella TaxID=51655 RepID=UPI002032E713|nr:uncharacterized protein LOC119691533 [Plutella xylostella]
MWVDVACKPFLRRQRIPLASRIQSFKLDGVSFISLANELWLPARVFVIKKTIMSSVMGHISIFDHNTQDWQIFLGRLEQFIKLNKIADDNKGALLLTHLSDETYRLAQNLVHPKNIVDVEFDGLVKELSGHFTPKRCTFADRAKFYEATRASGESVESWAARLRGLAVHCEFGSALELLLRDRFVLGMNAGPERDRLFETDATTVTFGKALEVAQQAACARQARQHLAPPPHVKEEPVYRVGDDRDVHRCQVCGLKGHEADKCRFKKYKCKQCGAKGHLKKVCAVKKCANRLNNLCAVESSDDAEGKSDGHICKECEVFNLRISK